MTPRNFIEYELTADILCIGERVKKGTFKPCIKTIPFSSITGALKDRLDIPGIYAVGKLEPEYLANIDQFKQIHVYAPRYVVEDIARLPLKMEFLTEVRAKIYVYLENGQAKEFIMEKKNRDFDITMGAFRSKGFGRCRLRFSRIIENPTMKKGRLLSRIPEKCSALFGIREIRKPVYGYLFEPVTRITGKYVRSLFEGSIVEGNDFLIEEENR